MFQTVRLLLVLLSIGASQSTQLTLTSSRPIIPIGGALNFSLTCSVSEDPAKMPGLREVYRLSIAKFDGSLWLPVVSMDSKWQTASVAEGLRGYAVFADKSFPSLDSVTVTWPNATNETAGQYECEVIGYDQTGRSSLRLSAPVRVEAEVPLTLYEVVKIIRSSTKRQNDIISDIDSIKKVLDRNAVIQETLTEQLDTSEATCNDALADIAVLDERMNSSVIVFKDTKADIQTLKNKMEKLETYPQTDVEALRKNVSQNQQALEVLSYLLGWPQGQFSLLQPESGCPDNSEWKTGLRKSHTESSSVNHDKVSTVLHLKKPVMEKVGSDSFMTQHFCTVETSSLGPVWPPGTYCIMRYQDDCPHGFDTGVITWDDEDTNKKVSIEGTTPVIEHGSGLMKIPYCCRKDSPPENAIPLPTSKPFYLHRYDGTCQSVFNMKVSEEYLLFNTEVNDNDSAFDSNTPDDKGSLPNVRLELCYYEKDD